MFAPSAFRLGAAVRALAAGGVVACPTESVWGLSCDPDNADAVSRLLALTERPVEKGLILVAASESQLGFLLSDRDPDQRARLSATWPGPNTWLVPHRPKRDQGRGFVLYRKPHKTAVDPETGELYDDLLVIRTANSDDKQALVDADGPFFTIDHFSGYNAVLVQQSRLGEITRDELVEVITEAWIATAPKRLVKEFLA